MATTYRFYRPLDERRRQIRLVRPPGQHRGVIELKISGFSLDANPTFTALSYCWGSTDATIPISINGITFYVRPNLWAYLDRVRETGIFGSSWLFIDDICIDQSSMSERNSQVRLMGDVYRNARLVDVWLGVSEPVNDQDHRLFEVLAKLLRRQTQDETSTSDELFALAKECWGCFEAFNSLCEVAYWDRLWIVQELTLAKTVVIRYKTLIVDRMTMTEFYDLGYLAYQALQETDKSPVDILSATTVLSLSMQMYEEAAERGLTLHRAITAFASQHCSRTHDNIFGLLGMTSSRITVDYRTPILDLYTIALVEGLLERQSLQKKASSPDMTWSDDTFYQLVAKGLGLDPCHAIVFLITEEVFQRVGVPRLLDAIALYYDPKLRDMRLPWPFDLGSPSGHALTEGIFRAVLWTRCSAVRLQLHISRLLDSFLPIAECDARHEKYSVYIDRIEQSYHKTFDKLFPGHRRDIITLAAELRDYNGTSLSEAERLVDRISLAPTAREIAELFAWLCKQVRLKLESFVSEHGLEGDMERFRGLILLIAEANNRLMPIEDV